MEFRHLRCFTVLAEELHFGRAAQRLAMTQPPLSLNIQQLEASVGAQLFTRNSRGVALTAAGQAFLPAARALLDGANEAARQARDVAQGLAGQLQIGFAGAVLYRGLPQMLQAFGQAHPGLRLVLRELSSSEQLIDLVHDRLDVGFVHTTRVPKGFSQILVSSQPFMACLPAHHAAAQAQSLSLDRLQGEPFAIVSRAVSADYHDRILAACADAGYEPELRLELQHWLSVVSVIGQGLGVGLVPAALAQAGLPGVVFRPLARPLLPYDTHCLSKDGGQQPALLAFLDMVRHTSAALSGG
ncbi:MAG: LysR family transcriptional regulator [Burkholderiales bacterium RIFCSPLOWO2_12_67_14]|nr:MAG: LysR family transcriptional regulator [Burkholderiales bacterium RIFCSPLOWO2_02_FULL_67_64]OGB39599.1 MAG: LysR family transcriptional regulator [Burkholderiales bacterium RIFCSPHIGHO2_12_FULL_67_38]OGB45785.1 MAG: LysR family transcriptional regulator [Burkholderiales bacterium RIFCSPLOWO2_12_67_14]